MFSFGQFAHFLPYLILAITSFAGLTSYTFSLSNQKLSKDEIAEKSIQIKETKDSNIDKLAYYQNYAGQKYQKTCFRFDVLLRNYCFLKSYPPGYSWRLVDQDLNQTHLQRPPPSLLFA